MSSIWGPPTSGNNINGLPSLGPGRGPVYQRYEEPAPVPPPVQAAQPKKADSTWEYSPTQMWSSDAVKKNMDKYKPLMFSIILRGIRYRATMLFATPENTVHTSNIPSTMMLQINSNKKESASFMFSNNMETNTGKVISDYLKTVKVDKESYKGIVPEKPTTVMIQSLRVSDINDTLPIPRPIGLKIEGVEGTFITPHRISFDPTISYAAIITRRESEVEIYKSGSTAAPEIEAIHGTGDCSSLTVNNINLWGRSSDGCISIPIMSEKAVFFFYYLAELIKKYYGDHKTFPAGMTQEQFEMVQDLHGQWQESNKQNGRPSDDIYCPQANLTDGHMGYIIGVFENSQGIAWSKHSEDPFFRVPIDFVKYISPLYDSHISGIVMTNITSIKMSAHYDNQLDHAAVPSGSSIFFKVNASTFIPTMVYTIEQVQDDYQ